MRTRQPPNGRENQVVIRAHGTYAGEAFTGEFVGGSVLQLRNNTKPYPVELTAQAGDTHIHLAGTIEDIKQFAGANLQLQIEGQDLADLYKIVHIPFQPSPPYALRGHLDYDNSGKRIRFSDFAGRVGESDLEGNFNVDRAGARPLVTADLKSNAVRMQDLGGFIGAAPGKEGAPTEGPKQAAAHAAADTQQTLLPNTPIDLSKVRSTDYRVHYRGEHIVTSWAPLDHIDAELTIRNGDIKLEPLDFAVGSGTIHSVIELNGHVNPIHAKADIDFRHVDFQRLLQTTSFAKGIGVIGGRWVIDGTGNSLAQILAHGNGDLKLFMGSGDLSAIIVNAAGLDVGGTILSLLGMPTQAKINCMVSDFALNNGVLDTRALVLDTDQGNVYGKGNIDLRDEGIAYQITEESKHFTIGALHAPIDITGDLQASEREAGTGGARCTPWHRRGIDRGISPGRAAVDDPARARQGPQLQCFDRRRTTATADHAANRGSDDRHAQRSTDSAERGRRAEPRGRQATIRCRNRRRHPSRRRTRHRRAASR
ncbi:MAG TPA: AsmA family protein [Stellaceae bacterium]|nr:AsmA family protein [Stellaceae bacterium]